MNRIDRVFSEKQRDVLSIYYPAGFPNLDDTVSIITELQAKGVDMVEIGIPFSDPMADGVVIQQAATKALSNGITLKRLFGQLDGIRDTVSIPIILMGYLNPIMQYGFEDFCISCKEVGVDGVIIPDLPYNEYVLNYKECADQYNINVIMLITPETSVERVKLIDDNTSGFIYMVSTAATTGAQNAFGDSTLEYFKQTESLNLKNPRLIGFGISNKDTYSSACQYANGAIVGSHFVKLLDSGLSIADAVDNLLKTLGRM